MTTQNQNPDPASEEARRLNPDEYAAAVEEWTAAGCPPDAVPVLDVDAAPVAPGTMVRALLTGELGVVQEVNPFGVPTVGFNNGGLTTFCQLSRSEYEVVTDDERRAAILASICGEVYAQLEELSDNTGALCVTDDDVAMADEFRKAALDAWDGWVEAQQGVTS